MIARPFWIERIEAAWSEAPIAWLSGVRRSGKTTYARRFGKLEVTVCEPDGIEH